MRGESGGGEQRWRGQQNITGLEHFVKQKMNFESLIAWYIDCTIVDSMLSA